MGHWQFARPEWLRNIFQVDAAIGRLDQPHGVDDILDSYYIVFIDFDEDEYFMETFPTTMSFSFFDTDVQDDRSFMLEDEVDFVLDFYTIYILSPLQLKI